MKTLILLHGWGADASAWDRQVRAFQDRFQVLAPTVSAWEPAWLAGYLQNHDLADCLLVGWSLGGMLLLEVLAGLQHTVGGLVLAGAAPVFCSRPDHPWGQPLVAVRAMRRGLRGNPGKVLQDFAASCLSPEEEAFAAEVNPLFTGENRANLATGLDYLLNRDLRPLLPQIAAPCAIIQGDRDTIAPPEQARFLQQHLPGSTLHLLPAAGHLPFWTQAGRFNAILQDIMEQKGG